MYEYDLKIESVTMNDFCIDILEDAYLFLGNDGWRQKIW